MAITTNPPSAPALRHMTPYQCEQLAAHQLVWQHIETLDRKERDALRRSCEEYGRFRRRVDRFLDSHFKEICSRKCYRSRESACCSRDGIVTFFGDVVVNSLETEPARLERLTAVLQGPPNGFKCIYLGPQGCLWSVRPLVCAMFLCDSAQLQVLKPDPELDGRWQALREAAKRFRWPDRPVLFDRLEAQFIAAGLHSPLMYLHNSPGLLRIKQRAGLVPSDHP